MKEIYNEGRVVGLSAYEIYVRQSLSQLPEEPIMSEREWISSTLGDGVSMILHIPKNTAAGVHDFQLPTKSKLCAAKTITASMFNGEVELNGSWATSVLSYGPLIDHPTEQREGQDLSKPTTSELNSWDESKIHMFREYMKVIDGVAFQPRLWEETYYRADGTEVTEKIPSNKYLPDLTKPGVVRIRLTKKLTEDLNILLSGFFHRPIVAGVSMFDSNPLDSPKPENGDFLGVEIYPWASKIVFTVPSEAYNALNTKAYVRELPDNSTEQSVQALGLVDFETTDPKTYYESTQYKKYANSQIPIDVKDLNVIGSGASVLGTYQRVDRQSEGYTGTDYPPVLYGVKVTTTGTQKMSPVDIVAPGTVKMFEDKDLAMNYPKVYPNIYSMHETTSGDIYIIKESTKEEDLIPLTTKVKVENFGTSSSPKYAVTTQARGFTEEPSQATISAVSLLKPDGTRLNTDGSSGTLDSQDTLNWTTLLNGLGSNKKVELLGADLKEFRSHLPNIVSGAGGILTIKGTGASSIAGSLSVGNSFSVTGATTVGSTLTVTGATTVGGVLTVNGTGTSSIAGPLNIKGKATVGGVLDVNGTGESSIAGDLTVSGSVTTYKHVRVQNADSGDEASEVRGNLKVGFGKSTGPNLEVNHGAVVGGNLVVGSAESAEDDLGYITVNGESSGGNQIVNTNTNHDSINFNKAIKSGKNYIIFSNGLRLYIAKSAPSTEGVPIGSIGIGW